MSFALDVLCFKFPPFVLPSSLLLFQELFLFCSCFPLLCCHSEKFAISEKAVEKSRYACRPSLMEGFALSGCIVMLRAKLKQFMCSQGMLILLDFL